MAVYIIRDLNLLHKLIKGTIEGLWKNTTVSELKDMGNQKRIEYTVDGNPAMLDVYQKNDGTTTFRAAGKNIEYTKKLIAELEKHAYPVTSDLKSFSMFVGDVWSKKTVDYLAQLTTEENKGFYETKTNNGNTIHSFTSAIGDKLTITECPDGKLLVQGKPLFLYNEFISFVSYSPNVNVEEIVAATKAFVTNKVMDAQLAREKMATLMPTAYGSGEVDDTIWKVFSPSMALMDIEAEMEDYSCIMFPALRALEGYLYFLLDEIGEKITRRRKVGDLFNVDPSDSNRFIMNKKPSANANRKGLQYKTEIEKVYTYYNKHRHVSFHINQIFVDTKVVKSKQEALDTVNDVAELIETSFVATHQ